MYLTGPSMRGSINILASVSILLWFSKHGPWASWVIPGNSLDTQILVTLSIPTKSGTVGWGPGIYIFISDSDACKENHWCAAWYNGLYGQVDPAFSPLLCFIFCKLFNLSEPQYLVCLSIYLFIQIDDIITIIKIKIISTLQSFNNNY